MSYIIGYKVGKSVFLIADSAITEDQPSADAVKLASQTELTSFGELNIDTPDRAVYEGALKIINLGSAAVAMSGDAALCRSAIRRLKRALLQANNPGEAFRMAVSIKGPFSHNPSRQVQLLMAFPQSPSPMLLSYNADGNRQVLEVEDNFIVQLGSLKTAYKSITPQIVSALKIFQAEPHRFLVACLASLQSYGIHSYILEQGVGGTFCGLLVGEHSIEWQKDILFCLHSGLDPNIHMVSSIIRDHVHVVRSNLTNSCRYLGDSINDGLSDAWRLRWWNQAFEFIAHGRFDFIVLLNTQFKIISIVEMLKRQNNKYLYVTPSPPAGPDESFRLHLYMSPMLTEAMVEPIQDRHDGSLPVKINWFPSHEA